MGTSKSTSFFEYNSRTGRPHKKMVDGKLQCSTCEGWKLPEEFYPAANTFHGRETRCKVCTLGRTRNYYNTNVEKYLTVLAKAHKQPSLRTCGTTRRRVLHSESCVTPELLIDKWRSQGGICAITGKPMTHVRGGGHSVKTNVSIDRINSDLGYTPENIRLVCKAANIMKYVHTDQELLEWASAIVSGPLSTTENDVS